jgi:hypothetical protein
MFDIVIIGVSYKYQLGILLDSRSHLLSWLREIAFWRASGNWISLLE